MEKENYNSRMVPLKIALGDLRHKTIGKHSSFMPVGLGYIASYTLAQINNPENLEIRFYTDPDKILQDITVWQPAVIGLANYCWNSQLSRLVFRYAKKKNPFVACIAGGPDFPTDQGECKEYLSKRPEIDLYVYFEGERAFASLIKKLQKGIEVSRLKSESQGGAMSIHPETGDLVFGPPMPRLMNLDEIPSPYLTGLMDQWFDGSYAPCIETVRGCPFTCGYCFVGSQQHYKCVATFSVERIKQELNYIAHRMSKYPEVLLAICDSNFGMFEHDEEIAGHISKLQDEFGWPNAFDVTTGRANHDRILRIANLLKNKMPIATSVQSLHPKTLEVIKRRNIPIEEYQRINAEIKKRGMRSVTEAIVPMPEETKESFFEGLKLITDVIGIDRVVPYTLMLLRGTRLASQECRKQYQLETKFRVVPRQFGQYFGQKCFEIEEVCVSTKTMSFDDYLDVRGFSLVLALFMSNQFDVVHKHLKELGISNYDYLCYLWDLIKSGRTTLSDIYQQYLQETKAELWDSAEAIYGYFSRPENYNKLLSSQLGDNLLRKYETKIFFGRSVSAIELAYLALEKVSRDGISQEVRQSLDAAKKWMVSLRNLSAIFKSELYVNSRENLYLPYDIRSWYLDGPDSRRLVDYKKPVVYGVFCDGHKLKRTLVEAKELWGGDLFFQVSKLLINWDIREFWRQCEPLEIRK